MPKRTDIHSILIIGAGPIVIGQACEFDYSGAQACKALREEGYRVILVNSNPATIMTDPEMADVTYIEPITWEVVERIIATEKPDAILPTMGGQTALNCALDLHRHGVLKKYGCELIGASPEAIDKAEDRQKFKDAMTKIGLGSAKSGIAHSMEEALTVQQRIQIETGSSGFPVVIRPSFTMGGSGGGIAYNREEFEEICKRGLDLSPTHELLIEESLLGWKEFEMEVVRDRADNCIIVCSIENLDPMGVHTGDSITVAPAQTLTDKEYQIMRNASIAVLREIGVDTGGSNVQFSINPVDGRMIVIEMNPRVSRSSALASKATGFPIAKVAAKLAVGYTLDELQNDITGGATPASFEPSIDYVVTKIPRFAFEKFREADPRLTTQMKSVGEVMAIGRTFQESFQKALRGLEVGVDGLDEKSTDLEDIIQEIGDPGPDRIWYVGDAFRMGMSIDEVFAESKIDPWFLEQIKELIELENAVKERTLKSINASELRFLKQKGFSDRRLAKLLKTDAKAVREARHHHQVFPVYKRVDTCAAEFATNTAYMYSTYEAEHGECESQPTQREKIMVLGGGPNRIGQGIEFDYCCVHAALAMRDDGYETIMVNCNPETVSTDYDTSDRLYFEPLTLEDVLEIVAKEKPKGVIVQYGGQTPLKLALDLEANGVPIIGTSPDMIDAAEDRERFQKLLHELKLRQPPNRTARAEDEALKLAEEIGYPLVVRPSYVLGGRAMEIVGKDVIYVLEVNPRASRTVPYVSKATGLQLAKIAARCMVGQSLEQQGITKEVIPPYYSVKEAVFPFNKFPGIDPILGPEMRSTGEVMGVGKTFGEALFKSQLAAGIKLPKSGNVVLTVKDSDKPLAVEVAKLLHEMGFPMVATKGTAAAIAAANIPVAVVNKVKEGRPHIVDMIKNGEITLVFTTVDETRNAIADSRSIRTTAQANGVTYYTTISAARAVMEGMRAKDSLEVYSLQNLHIALS